VDLRRLFQRGSEFRNRSFASLRGRPKVREGSEVHANGSAALYHIDQSSVQPSLRQFAGAAQSPGIGPRAPAFSARGVDGCRVEEHPESDETAPRALHGSRYGPAGTGHASHLAYPKIRVVSELQSQQRKRMVERSVREREVARVCDLEANARIVDCPPRVFARG
jgi:hypothetical protein